MGVDCSKRYVWQQDCIWQSRAVCSASRRPPISDHIFLDICLISRRQYLAPSQLPHSWEGCAFTRKGRIQYPKLSPIVPQCPSDLHPSKCFPFAPTQLDTSRQSYIGRILARHDVSSSGEQLQSAGGCTEGVFAWRRDVEVR